MNRGVGAGGSKTTLNGLSFEKKNIYKKYITRI